MATTKEAVDRSREREREEEEKTSRKGRKPDESDKHGIQSFKSREDEEASDRARLKTEHEEVTPERLSELMTEKAALKTEYAAHRKVEDEAHQARIHELDIQIARGQPYNPGKTV